MKEIKSNNGMTLIELIFIIAIISLLFSLVLPKIEERDNYLLSISRVLRDDIRYIRYLRMTEGKNIKISLERDKYKIMEGVKVIKKIELKKDFKIVHSSTFRSGNIFFGYNGVPAYGGGTITIFDNKTNRHCQITVVPSTGRILLKDEIYDGYSGK